MQELNLRIFDKYLPHFKRVEKLSSYFTDFERVGHGCLLDTLLNPVKIFSWSVVFILYCCSCVK